MQNVLFYLITVIIWGSTWLAIKFQLGMVSPELSISYRFWLSAAILLMYSLARRLPLRFSWRAHAFMALQGFFLFSLNYIMVYLAEGYLPSGLVAIIFSMIVIFNVIFGAIFLHNPIRMNVIIGALVGFAGLIIVFWPEISSFDFSSHKTLGVILTFLGATSASLGNIISARNQRNRLPVIQTNVYGMAYGALFMLVLALFRDPRLTFDPSMGYVLSLLYLAIFGSVIAFYTYLTLLGKIGPDRAAYVNVLFPIIALLLSTLFEGMTWGLPQFAGVALVLLGNAIALIKLGTIRSAQVIENK
jgi:drug/metabolite transporter (DMT)-like permease